MPVSVEQKAASFREGLGEAGRHGGEPDSDRQARASLEAFKLGLGLGALTGPRALGALEAGIRVARAYGVVKGEDERRTLALSFGASSGYSEGGPRGGREKEEEEERFGAENEETRGSGAYPDLADYFYLVKPRGDQASVGASASSWQRVLACGQEASVDAPREEPAQQRTTVPLTGLYVDEAFVVDAIPLSPRSVLTEDSEPTRGGDPVVQERLIRRAFVVAAEQKKARELALQEEEERLRRAEERKGGGPGASGNSLASRYEATKSGAPVTPLLPGVTGSGLDRSRFRNPCSGCGEEYPDHKGSERPGRKAREAKEKEDREEAARARELLLAVARVEAERREALLRRAAEVAARASPPSVLPPQAVVPRTQGAAAGYAREREAAAKAGRPESRIALHPTWGHREKLYVIYGGAPPADFGVYRCSWRQALQKWGQVVTGKGFEEEASAREWARALPGWESLAQQGLRWL